ncbi:hypothetical protein [Methylovirgula sp. 4M-Z18]|uniref:hypothetical protein n=1 Tax=Methylovirgula sp. 4M-Z18 TaxID=2293567 RepID=UPI001AECE558|nr:hypothetical protein [Methylovirgula sp. 4M-Z18]
MSSAQAFDASAPCRVSAERRNSLEAIFLHSSFRASSTWVWSRFRRMDDVLAYHEIFHEILATLTRANCAELTARTWHSKHPDGAPYFEEFEPLIQSEGGVAHFTPAMAFENFVPQGGFTGSLTSDERTYVRMLIDHAQNLARTPVLADTRSLGRVIAIKADFPGLHIVLYRNLFQQWCSYSEQLAHHNPYFMETIKRTIESSPEDRFFKLLRQIFPLGRPSLTDANYFYCFVLLHLYLYAQVAEAADMVIDVNALECDRSYRRAVEGQIVDKSGVNIDFADVKKSIAFSFTPLGSVESVSTRLSAMVDDILAHAPSAAGRAFVQKALGELLDEYERYMFYAGALANYAAPDGMLAQEFDNEWQQLNREMQSVLQSTSWRVTAPLRGVKNWLRA